MSVISQVKSLFPESWWPRLWLVGGTVRDLLLNQPVQDIDLVAVLSPDELFALHFTPVDPVSSAPIWFRHDTGIGTIEITRLAKAEQLKDDLTRRDFTVNALAMTLEGSVIDLYSGQHDLEQRVLRPCSAQSFLHDPIRIFRAFRFAADGWRISPEAEQLIAERAWEERFSTIPVERFSREMTKALAARDPACFFRSLVDRQIGATYLPELFSMPAVPAGPPDKHPEGDLFTHSLQVLERVAAASADPLARFCGLFHDLGKLETDPTLYPRHFGHDNAGFEPARRLCTRLRLPAAWRNALAFTCRLHTKANTWHELRTSTRIRLAEQATRAGIAPILPLISAADKPNGPGMAGWDAACRVIALPTQELGVDPVALAEMPVQQRSHHIHQRRVFALTEALKSH